MSSPYGLKKFSDLVSSDFFRAYRFTVSIIDPKSGDPFIAEWISSAATPVSTTTVQNIDFMKSQIKVEGRTTYQPLNVMVRDVIGKNKSWDYFNNWRNEIFNPKSPGLYNTPYKYKRVATIKLLTPNNMDDVYSRSYILYGLWPFEVGSIPLDYDAQGIITFPVTFCLDYFIKGKLGV